MIDNSLISMLVARHAHSHSAVVLHDGSPPFIIYIYLSKLVCLLEVLKTNEVKDFYQDDFVYLKIEGSWL